MCTHYGNNKKWCYIPPYIYIGVVSVPDHPGCIVRRVTPPWTHPIWCDYLHLSGVYIFFPTQGRLFCFPKQYFFITRAHHIHIVFIKICNTPTCYPKYEYNIWLYSTLEKSRF